MDRTANECIAYMMNIAKKMEYEGTSDLEDIVSLGNSVFGLCMEKFDPNKSPDFVLFFKKRFLYAIKDLSRYQNRQLCFSANYDDFEVEEWVDSGIRSSFTVEKEQKKTLMRIVIGRLSCIEKQVMIMKFFDRMPQRDIALLIGKTESRVSQIVSESILKLRSMPEVYELAGFFKINETQNLEKRNNDESNIKYGRKRKNGN